MTQRRVVITGMGLRTSVGSDIAGSWAALIAGRKGIRRIDFWDSSQYQTKVAAQVIDIPEDLSDVGLPSGAARRTARLYSCVVDEAAKAAQLDTQAIPATEIGQAVGISVNYIDIRHSSAFYSHRRCSNSFTDLKRLSLSRAIGSGRLSRRFGDTNAACGARRWKLEGPSLVTDTACAASLHAVGEAYRRIRRGEVRAMIAGGSAALVSPLAILSFSLLGALSRSEDPESASRPFDKYRDGFVMGEGAGAVVLESLDSALERGAPILAELSGYGSNLTAMTMTDPSPDGSVESAAIRLALREAKLDPEDIDLVVSHGTSTPKNDATETLAIKRAFGKYAHRLMVSSNKGQIGHTISAAGICNLIVAVKTLETSIVPPTVNLDNPDSACDLDYVPNVCRHAQVRNAVVNAFAFGGQNAVVAVKSYKR